MEGDRTGPRCTRVDCTSCCNNDQLRGDPLKNRRKNKHLHEQLIALQCYTSAQEAQTQQTLQRKGDEILRLSNQVAGLTLKMLQQESILVPTLSIEKLVLVPLEQNVEALTTHNEVLENNYGNAKKARKTADSLKFQRQVIEVDKESTDKQNEPYTTLKMNEMLRDEVVHMQEAKKKLLDQGEQFLVLMYTIQNQVERYRDAVDEQTLQLQTKVRQLELKKLSLIRKLIEIDERKADVNAVVSDTKAVLREKATLIAELDELRRKLMQHDQHQRQDKREEDTVCVNVSTATDDLEKQLKMLQELRIRDNSAMFELSLQQLSDAKSRAEHLDIDAVVESAIQATVQEQKGMLEGSEQDNTTLDRHLKKHLVHGLKARQGIVTKQLVEVEERNAKPEQQAGLEDVKKHQKKLRVQLRQEQQMDVALSQELDEQVEADGKLQLAHQRLKAEDGNPGSLKYDSFDIADHLKCQLLTKEAVAKQAKIQIYELEAERLRFLHKLRDQAGLTDHRLCEQDGCTTDQWIAVEEFIDSARHTSEVIQPLQQPGYKFVGVGDQEQSARRAKDQPETMVGLQRKLGIRCVENAHYLNDTEWLQNELAEAQSHLLAPAIPQPVSTPDDDRGENLRAIEAAKVKWQQQERVCYYLRPEVACSKVQNGDDDEGLACVVKNNKPQLRQAERCTNVTGRGEEHLVSSEGRASVDELQHQLMQIKVTYQQFRVQYDLLIETQQQTLLEYQRLVPEMEKKAQELNAVREKSSDKIQIMEKAICPMNDRDWTARSTKWEAFRKRLNALEDAIQVEQLRRKQLNEDVENKQAELPLLNPRQECGNQGETGQLKNQADAIRERLLIASNTIGWKENGMRLQAELIETRILNEDLNRQLELIQSGNLKLLRLDGELEAEKRELRSKYEDLELDLQNTSTRLLDREKKRQSNQRDLQVTIASLTQLLEDKNTLVNEYKRKLTIVQALSTQDKVHARLETTQLTEENQRMIMQLKKTMIAVGIVERSGKSKQALQAAQECRGLVVQEWKQAKVALNNARQSIWEFQSKQKVLQNERDLAEARAMEALEETVLMREKEEKLKLMCEAIIKLKEELLKPEDLHAIEFAKAQKVMNQDICARKESEGREDNEKKWQEEKTRLHSQVQILQKKLVLLELQNQQQRTKRNAEKEAAKDKKSALETDLQALRDVKRLINDQVVSETRAVDKLEEKIKALQSENVALRLASTHTPVALIDIAGAKEKCEQVEIERKLQRRVDILTLHLNEKQMIVANKDTCCRNRILNLESELQFEQARHEKEHLTQNASVPAANSMFAKQQVEELEFPNAFLRERLALSRKEWRKPFSAKMTSNKAQLQHLRWRLVQNSVSFNSSAPDHDMNDTIGYGSNSQIQREEQHFLVGQEVQEESLAHSNELRNKKQQVMAKNTRLLELELENESLRLEYVRLRRKTRYGSGDLQDAQKQLSGAKGIGSGGRRSLWAAHEWLELEDVVKKMKALIEELRAENKKLKKATAKQASVFLEREDSMRRKLKEQKDVQKRLEVQLQKPHHESSELKKDKLRHQEKLCAKAATLSLRKKLSNLLELQLKEKDW